ncbi:MAG: MFS transporter [bacterium]|nr:MFS transporter [bacterium]
MTDTLATTPHTRRLWVIIGLVCVPVFLGSVDLTVVSAFLPTLIVELHLPVSAGGISGVSWILSSYLLMYSISLFIMGRVSDFIGRRLAFTICLILYVVGATIVITYDGIGDSLMPTYTRMNLDPYSAHLHILLLGRSIQALGAGAVTAIALALVGDLFPQGKRALPSGIVAGMDTIGWLIGAAYAGVVVQFLPWRAIFLINMPLVLLALLGMLWALQGIKTERIPMRFDFLGTITLIGALVSFNIALATLDVSGATDTPLVPLLILSVIFTALFLFIEGRIKNPLIRLGIFMRNGFSPAMWVNGVVGFCLFISLAAMPLLVNVKSLGDVGRAAVLRPDLLTAAALISGIMMGAFTIPLAITTMFSSRLLKLFGARNLTIAGLVMGGSGFFALWQFLRLDVSYIIVAGMMAVAGTGLGLTFTPVIITIMDAVSESERGVASALLLGIRMVAMSAATSTLGVYADARVIYLVQSVERGGFLIDQVAPKDYPLWFFNSYVNATIQAVNEMALFGFILCAVALIGAWLLPKRKMI